MPEAVVLPRIYIAVWVWCGDDVEVLEPVRIAYTDAVAKVLTKCLSRLRRLPGSLAFDERACAR